MDGVFMRKQIKRIGLCGLLCALVWTGALFGDRQTLNRELIRLHVVAASDSEEDQQVKLRVRDAVTQSLEAAMADVRDTDQAKSYLQENLEKIQTVANGVLDAYGLPDRAKVTLEKESFDTRHYDTFSLPAGIYDALRITIGEGQGQNWWCVVFPTLCIPATTEGFGDVAAGAGFSDALVRTLEGEESYELRFFLLDAMGKLENILFAG